MSVEFETKSGEGFFVDLDGQVFPGHIDALREEHMGFFFPLSEEESVEFSIPDFIRGRRTSVVFAVSPLIGPLEEKDLLSLKDKIKSLLSEAGFYEDYSDLVLKGIFFSRKEKRIPSQIEFDGPYA